MEIDEHIGCAMSGLTADARTLVEYARVETQVFVLCLGVHASENVPIFCMIRIVVYLLFNRKVAVAVLFCSNCIDV